MTLRARNLTLLATLLLAIAAFFAGQFLYDRQARAAGDRKLVEQNDSLVRPHAYVFGRRDAPVTLVEFFDPACEACRAFHPFVKKLLAQYPRELRLVLRYAPFHEGSESVVRLLEAARGQERYPQVLEAVLAAQPEWADHHRPRLERAQEAAQAAGLDVPKALVAGQAPEVTALIAQDIQDLKALGVRKTPSFFVNGRSLPSFGPDQLAALVAEEVAKAAR